MLVVFDHELTSGSSYYSLSNPTLFVLHHGNSKYTPGDGLVPRGGQSAKLEPKKQNKMSV